MLVEFGLFEPEFWSCEEGKILLTGGERAITSGKDKLSLILSDSIRIKSF